MPEISLANLSLALGALMVITAVFGLVKTEGAMDWAKNFPRNETAGWTLMLAGMAWFLWVLKSETLADFEKFRMLFKVFIVATGVGACFFLKDFLAVRGLAVVLLLLAKLIVDTARWHESEWRLVLVVLAYALVIKAMWFTVAPWRMRDILDWATASERRFKMLCGVRLAFAVLLVVLGLTIFK
jgi:multisubunit Na+/H+ antiporter MnhG subunit